MSHQLAAVTRNSLASLSPNPSSPQQCSTISSSRHTYKPTQHPSTVFNPDSSPSQKPSTLPTWSLNRNYLLLSKVLEPSGGETPQLLRRQTLALEQDFKPPQLCAKDDQASSCLVDFGGEEAFEQVLCGVTHLSPTEAVIMASSVQIRPCLGEMLVALVCFGAMLQVFRTLFK